MRLFQVPFSEGRGKHAAPNLGDFLPRTPLDTRNTWPAAPTVVGNESRSLTTWWTAPEGSTRCRHIRLSPS